MDEQVRFSNAFLLEQWAKNNGIIRTATTKRNRKVASSKEGRTYQGQTGLISKDGKNGWYDVDHRGRKICV